MEDLEPILAAHPFFKGLDPTFLRAATGCASNVRFEEGSFIAHEGEDAEHFYLIRHGKVSLEIYAPNHGAVNIQTVEEGDIFGASWLIPPYRWRFDARALELTRAIAIDGKCLRKKCEENHDLGYEVMKRVVTVLSERLEAARLQLIDVYGAHK